ncbi:MULTISPECIES: hydrogenase maturation protease [Rhodococcus]|uniref:Hydrogenase maturation protease n=1 Tax=Rhodococcus opacus RKJ300 = JCM 13270 TaxID=1165867 RepID=I0WNA5_RHOOP|nr:MULTISPECIES: hydrogenase maturation protease [Rhodococcus]EID77871.1 hydrogenase maturation protease [Rhodococcus opacus RKJ300 = JCM 13270]QQZ17046.1 hydrogenase maturation protease [Rhodococcus sp. 21391]
MTVVVIGLGNDLRRDDGIGPTVARQVADHVAPDVCVSVSDGDPATLLEAWTGAQLAVIVDAVVCDPPRPGTVYRLTPDELGDVRAGTFSTHGIALDHTVRLGAVLDRLPHRMIVLAVEVADLGGGRGLSPAVGRAVDTAVSAVLSVIGEHSDRMS